jgi:hypothetical protein
MHYPAKYDIPIGSASDTGGALSNPNPPISSVYYNKSTASTTGIKIQI